MLREVAEIFLTEVPVWSLAHDATALTRTFRARSYDLGVRLVEDIRALAEQQDHRPTLYRAEGHL
jgi:pterin-4a-carbinolamine dehydratase